MESYEYDSKYKEDMDMVFDKNVKMSDITNFENQICNRICSSSYFKHIIAECTKRKLICRTHIFRSVDHKGNYISSFNMEILSSNNLPIPEGDEPSSCLMICETICYKRYKHLKGIELNKDNEFLYDLNQLLVKIKKLPIISPKS